MTHLADRWVVPLLAFLAEWSIRWGIVLGLLALWFSLRPSRRAATRHILCLAALAAGVLLPISPRWGGAILPWPSRAERADDGPPAVAPDPVGLEGAGGDLAAIPTIFDPISPPRPREAADRPPLPVQAAPVDRAGTLAIPSLDARRLAALVAAGAWAAIALVLLARVIVGGLALARLRREAVEIDWESDGLLDECRRRLGLSRRAGLATHPAITSPVVAGGLRPLVLVPVDWGQWPESHRRACLLHELAHLARYDDWAKLAQELIRAPFFFHPLVRWLASRLDRERELLCDEAAVARGSDPIAYARLLLDLARRPGRPLAAAHSPPPGGLPFFNRRTIGIRIDRLLEKDLMSTLSRASTARFLLLVPLALAMALGIGGLRVGTAAAQQSGPKATPTAPPTNPATKSAGRPAAPAPKPDAPADRDTWARRLADLRDANWRTAFAVGQELAALPGDEGFAILEANWGKIDNVDARQQFLKAWTFAGVEFPHPHILDVLDLGMRDPSPAVQGWAINYLSDIALRDFSEDFQGYKDWYQASRGKPVPEVLAESARRLAEKAERAKAADAPKLAEWVNIHGYELTQRPEARRAALDAGLLHTLGRWASSEQVGESRLAPNALRIIGGLKPGEAELRRLVVPLLAEGKPDGVRSAAIGALEGKENAWAIDLLLDELKRSLEGAGEGPSTITWSAASTLASFDDPKVIPTMIAVIDADNTYNTVYGVGHFGLSKLTEVQYAESHDGAWWRQWWEKNKERYPATARAIAIPDLPKRPRAEARAEDDPLADVADVPAQDLRAGGDEMKRYFLIGAEGSKPPAEGYGLLIVLPGGDGSADFQPFIRRIHKNVLNGNWLIAQAVAPKWDANQFNTMVWPTAARPYPAAKFTTEEFVRDIAADVRSKAKVDPRKVFLLGWSSGGPPCYAIAMGKEPGVAGAFIAMSVFQPRQLPAVEGAKGRPFYLLQSPDDRITPMRHADDAEKALQAAGAKVHLQRYEGGHGWHGDIWEMLGEGISWLDRQAAAK